MKILFPILLLIFVAGCTEDPRAAEQRIQMEKERIARIEQKEKEREEEKLRLESERKSSIEWFIDAKIESIDTTGSPMLIIVEGGGVIKIPCDPNSASFVKPQSDTRE